MDWKLLNWSDLSSALRTIAVDIYESNIRCLFDTCKQSESLRENVWLEPFGGNPACMEMIILIFVTLQKCPEGEYLHKCSETKQNKQKQSTIQTPCKITLTRSVLRFELGNISMMIWSFQKGDVKEASINHT